MPRLITAARVALLLAVAVGMLPGCKPKDEPPAPSIASTTAEKPAPSVAATPTTKQSTPVKPVEPAPEVKVLPKEEDPEVAAYFKAKGWRVGEDSGYGDRGVYSLEFAKRNNPGEFVLTPDDIKMLQRAKKVQVIDTYELELSEEVLAKLTTLPHLMGFILYGDGVTDAMLGILTKAKDLEVLRLTSAPSVTDAGVRQLAKLPKLRQLHLGTHGIDGSCFEAFAGAKALRRVEVGSPALTDAGILWLSKVPGLNSLSVSGGKDGKLTSAGIIAMIEPRLPYEFQCHSELIDDALLEALVTRGWLYGPKPEGMKWGKKPETAGEVRRVSLAGYPVTDKGVSAVLSKFPNIAELHLDGSGATDAILKSLAGQRKLTVLGVGGTKINGSGLGALSGLPIADLNVFKCDLTEEAFIAIGKLPELTRLNLQGAKFKPAWLKHIAALPKLQYLDLLQTDTDDAAAKSLAALPAIEELSMAGTPLGDKGFLELARVPTLRNLSVGGTKVTKAAYDKAQVEHPMLRLRHKDFD